MKITSISAMNYAAKKQNPSHKGLWGKSTEEKVESSHYDSGMMCDMGVDHYVKTKYYYPFLKESKEEIERIRNSNTAIDKHGDDFYSVIHETKVEIMKPIPVTEEKYNQYIKRELLSKEEMKVEDKLKIAKLQKFLR